MISWVQPENPLGDTLRNIPVKRFELVTIAKHQSKQNVDNKQGKQFTLGLKLHVTLHLFFFLFFSPCLSPILPSIHQLFLDRLLSLLSSNAIAINLVIRALSTLQHVTEEDQ